MPEKVKLSNMRSFEKHIYLIIFFEDDILPFFLLYFLALFAIAMAVHSAWVYGMQYTTAIFKISQRRHVRMI
jgi:hypothetical protein